jgi:hypothetical protein
MLPFGKPETVTRCSQGAGSCFALLTAQEVRSSKVRVDMTDDESQAAAEPAAVPEAFERQGRKLIGSSSFWLLDVLSQTAFGIVA